jgi:hypothetical protein
MNGDGELVLIFVQTSAVARDATSVMLASAQLQHTIVFGNLLFANSSFVNVLSVPYGCNCQLWCT